MDPINQLKLQFSALQSEWSEESLKVRQLLTHCLYCIYRQQDLSTYLIEAMTVTKIMRAHHTAISDMQSKTSSLPSELLKSVSAATLRDTITQVICDIMKSICIEIVTKMKKLGIVVKEPLTRRASADDYLRMFDQFSRKNANS
jgi:hypothetical protein